MADINLTQADADALIAMEKHRATEDRAYDPMGGQSLTLHVFNFVIPKSRQQPERIIQTINKPSRDTAQVVVLSWIDTKEVRSPESRAYALLNDSEQAVSPAAMDALRRYDVRPVRWSHRDDVRQELAA